MLTIDQARRAHYAFNRFGLGAKPGGMARIGADAKAALLAELDTPGIALIDDPALPTYHQACQKVHTTFENEHGLKEMELSARIGKHMDVEIGFVERLVLFFSNHFSMSINKDGSVRATIGQLERDVIRKNVLGSFKAMLIGVMKHPAMISYLDNADSIGPNSPIGLSWGVGINHNLAREILELHTVGVNGGYTEADIDALAKVISGWSYVRGWEADSHYNGGNAKNRGEFIFRRDWHEPGSQTILGRTYSQAGIKQGEAVLAKLAEHPSTAQFLAFKLVRHFITDAPTPAQVDPVADAYSRSGGNIKATVKALLNLPDAWAEPLGKLRTPYELQIAEMRAMNRTYRKDQRWPFDAALYELHNLPWERPTPDGYPEETPYWISPDAMRIRLETAQLHAWALLQIKPYPTKIPDLAKHLFYSVLAPESRGIIGQAATQQDKLAMLFMTPEFQRR